MTTDILTGEEVHAILKGVTDFDKEALRIAKEIWDTDRIWSEMIFVFSHAIRDLLTGSAEPSAYVKYSTGELPNFAPVIAGKPTQCVMREMPEYLPLYTRPQLPPAEKEELERLRKEVAQGHPLNCNHINQGSMDATADAYELEYAKAKCRESYDNYYHKIRADIGYDDWQKAWLKGFAKGSQELTQLRAENAALDNLCAERWEQIAALNEELAALREQVPREGYVVVPKDQLVTVLNANDAMIAAAEKEE